jgi:hypothetical protein
MSQGKLPENVMAQVKIILGKWERSPDLLTFGIFHLFVE